MIVDSGASERVVGAMVGLAVGDALGVPVEFEPRSARDADPVRGMRGGGTWGLEPGTWSDDASLAFCLAESIVEKGFDPEDSARRSLAWMDEGLWSARGSVFDVGGATRRALGKIRSGVPAAQAGGRGENDNGNGSLMKILPASVWLATLPEPARFQAVASYSAVTHGHPRSLMGCWFHCLVAARLLAGEGPREAYEGAMAEARSRLDALPASVKAEAGAYRRVLDGGLPSLPRTAVRGSGYVVHCLEASLWCLLATESFESCVLEAVNLGEDADTTAAVAGGLAGLAYGRAAIPSEWTSVLAREVEIESLAARLASLVAAGAPLPRSYWVLPGKLLAGGYPGRGRAGREAELRGLLDVGVDAFLDLTEPGEDPTTGPYEDSLAELSAARPVARRTCPLRDMSADPAAVQCALGEIDALMDEGRTVYVHCLGGLGRTGLVVASYLVEKGLAPPGRAASLLASFRMSTDTPLAESPQTEDQRRLVASHGPGPSALSLL